MLKNHSVGKQKEIMAMVEANRIKYFEELKKKEEAQKGK
jgi:hypothetical protein